MPWIDPGRSTSSAGSLNWHAMETLRWTTPEALPLKLAPSVLAELLDGGQSFRWQRLADNNWIGTWSEHIVRLSLREDMTVEWQSPVGQGTRARQAVCEYLSIRPDHQTMSDNLPWRSDSHLAACMKVFPGLRILRQPFAETLLCFMCSPTKQIAQIKQMFALLALRLGTRLAPDIHRLPDWQTLSRASESALRDCKLGFRARDIHATAQFLASNPGWLEITERAPYEEAKTRLCSLPGVGEKVADCVLLFGAARWEAFPVDTWIVKSLTRHYGLDGWTPAMVAHFGRVHFGPSAGLAQQYLFAYERLAKANG